MELIPSALVLVGPVARAWRRVSDAAEEPPRVVHRDRSELSVRNAKLPEVRYRFPSHEQHAVGVSFSIASMAPVGAIVMAKYQSFERKTRSANPASISCFTNCARCCHDRRPWPARAVLAACGLPSPVATDC